MAIVRIASHGIPLSKSVTAGLYPETLRPILSGRNILKLLVDPPVCQVERVGNTRHRLETDEIPIWSTRRIYHHGLVLRSERHFHAFGFSLHPHRCPAGGVPNQIAEYVVEAQTFQWAALRLGKELLNGPDLACRNVVIREEPFRTRGYGERPIVPRGIVHLKIGVKSDRYGHRRCA